jgi:hypothetical protein
MTQSLARSCFPPPNGGGAPRGGSTPRRYRAGAAWGQPRMATALLTRLHDGDVVEIDVVSPGARVVAQLEGGYRIGAEILTCQAEA